MRSLAVLSLLIACAAALPGPSQASGGFRFALDGHHDPDLGWAIVSRDDTSMSDLIDLDRINDLKKDFGEEFLYIRDGRARYVIRDRRLIERARDANESIQKFGREIGIIARAQVREAFRSWGDDDEASDRLSEAESRKLEERQEVASKRLQRAVQRIRGELREILREAKARRLATKVG